MCCCHSVASSMCLALWLQGCAVEPLLEDVGCLFLLDMLLGNADRMPCPDLGWRGNANNLLYGAPGGLRMPVEQSTVQERHMAW